MKTTGGAILIHLRSVTNISSTKMQAVEIPSLFSPPASKKANGFNRDRAKTVSGCGKRMHTVRFLHPDLDSSSECDMITPTIDPPDIIRIIICGRVYETLQTTLQKFPNTLLGNESKRLKYFLPSRNALFFDRNRQAFEAILYYYQTGGVLIRPPSIPMILFIEEIAFFELGEEACLRVQRNEGYLDESEMVLPDNHFLCKIWLLFEYADSSRAARFVAGWSALIVFLSIILSCLETIPNSKNPINNEGEQPWISLELFCGCWFLIEYLVRFISSPSKCEFFKSFLNTIDLLSILPYILNLCVDMNMAPLAALRIVRLIKIFRIFKLSRHSLSLRILGYTLKASINGLLMLIFLLILGVMVFASAIYYCEEGQNEMFKTIPDALWYSMVTMTTVGYGDKYPMTTAGRIVGITCALVGVLTIALPIPVIVSNFVFFYKRDRLKYEEKKKYLSVVQQKEMNGVGVGVDVEPESASLETIQRNLMMIGTRASVRRVSSTNVKRERSFSRNSEVNNHI